MTVATLIKNEKELDSLYRNTIRNVDVPFRNGAYRKPDVYPVVAHMFTEYSASATTGIVAHVSFTTYSNRDLRKFYYSRVTKKKPYFSDPDMCIVSTSEEMNTLIDKMRTQQSSIQDRYDRKSEEIEDIFESGISKILKSFANGSLLVSIHVRRVYCNDLGPDAVIVSVLTPLIVRYDIVVDYMYLKRHLDKVNGVVNKNIDTFENRVVSMFGIYIPYELKPYKIKPGNRGIAAAIKEMEEMMAEMKRNGG